MSIPHGLYRPYPASLTAEEFNRLLQIRLETLAAATAELTRGGPLPIPWRKGWKAHLDILGRSRDGCVLAVVTVAAPHDTTLYTRRIRLVSEARLKL